MVWANDLHIDRALTNVSAKYRNTNFIADKIFPNVSVKKESDVLNVYGKDGFKLPQTLRAAKSESKNATWNVGTTSYILEEHALKDLISDRERDNADEPLNLDIDTTEFLTDVILLRREKEVQKLCFTTTTWSQNASATSTARWSSLTTTSDPIGDIQTGTTIILTNAAVKPNTLVIGYDGFAALKNHPNIIERIKYSERGIVSTDLLSSLFDVANVIVGEAIIDSAAENIAASNTFVWASDALLMYVSPNPGLRQVSAGYTLNISSGGMSYKTKKWREEKLGGDYVEVSTMFVPKAVCTLAGYFFNNYIA